MPRLIGDIGGTTSRWVLVPNHGEEPVPIRLPGFNPTSGEASGMQAGLRQYMPLAQREALQVTAYGAGCGAKSRAERLLGVLAEVWPGADIEVESDLLGAARALYGKDAGMVLILGTGMNVGYYTGSRLHQPMPSLGFVLGDEGSGADIGKHLLRDALYGEISGPLKHTLFPDGLDLATVLEAIHRAPGPQAYLASFTARLVPHLEHPKVQELIASRFEALSQLLDRFFTPEERNCVRACGSVAFGFRGLLAGALAPTGMRLTAAEAEALPGLLRYHAAVA